MNLAYILLALAGVGLLVALNRLLLSRPPLALDRAAAEALLRRDEPDLTLDEFGGSAQAALATSTDHQLYAIAVAGDHLVSRKLSAANLRRVERIDALLLVYLRDPGFSRLRVQMTDREQAWAWEARLSALSFIPAAEDHLPC